MSASNPQLITVQDNTSAGTLTDEQFKDLVSGLAMQAADDFNESCWVTQDLAPAITVEAVARGAKVPDGSWHIELLDVCDDPGALGYHEDAAFDRHSTGPKKASGRSSRGLRAGTLTPLSKIGVKTSREDGVDPAEVASHEMLEMTVDPNVVSTVRSVVNPAKKQKVIVEVGDPVQECGYKRGNVTVADFALPAWFGYPQKVNPTQMSFRSSVKEPFELAPGGYISVAPEGTEDWTQIFGSAGR